MAYHGYAYTSKDKNFFKELFPQWPLADNSLFHFELTSVDKMVFKNGATGESKNIKYTKLITDILNDFQYKSAIESTPSDGWSYIIDIYLKTDGKPLSICWRNPDALEFEGKTYTAVHKDYFSVLFNALSN